MLINLLDKIELLKNVIILCFFTLTSTLDGYAVSLSIPRPLLHLLYMLAFIISPVLLSPDYYLSQCATGLVNKTTC